jgi:hypothetical protein
MTTGSDDEHDELFCWKVQGLSDEYTGYMAEEEAQAVARRIGGNCFAFPLYVRSQSAQEWVGLTDVEVGDALIELPILGNGYFLRIARAIEAKLKEKNT